MGGEWVQDWRRGPLVKGSSCSDLFLKRARFLKRDHFRPAPQRILETRHLEHDSYATSLELRELKICPINRRVMSCTDDSQVKQRRVGIMSIVAQVHPTAMNPNAIDAAAAILQNACGRGPSSCRVRSSMLGRRCCRASASSSTMLFRRPILRLRWCKIPEGAWAGTVRHCRGHSFPRATEVRLLIMSTNSRRKWPAAANPPPRLRAPRRRNFR